MPNRGVTERRIAEAALELVDAHGVDGLSMRKLAQSVGVAPMSLYTYFPDRDAVLEALTQLVLAEIDVPDEELDWRETIRWIMRQIRRVGLRHPNVTPLINRFPPRTLDSSGVAKHVPNVVRIGPTLAGQDDAAEFEYGLELLLSGFAEAMGVRP